MLTAGRQQLHHPVGGEHIEWVDSERPADRLREVLVSHALRLRSAALLGAA
ncbi:hypothetical protein MAHJHV50_50830 [Mycobacterium avium subsp. hominissuis]